MRGGLEEGPRIVGRYAMFGRLAAGGMATVQLGRMMGPAGFSRVVAMKRMHPQFARDPEFVAMFLDEARLAARVRHPNVVSSTDVVAEAGELFIVMEYVEGEALSSLLKVMSQTRARAPMAVVVAVVVQALHGLHAAHEAKSEAGMPLGIVHRDVSPQNVLVGVDGLARVVDFGIARAAGRAQNTQEGVLKGKVSYMAPEQIRSEPVDRRVDVYAAGVVLWEALTGLRLYKADTPLETFDRVLRAGAAPPSTHDAAIPTALDAVILKALSPARDDRWATALEFADALEQALTPASHRTIGKWVETVAKAELAVRARLVSASEGSSAPGEVAADALDAPTTVDPPEPEPEPAAPTPADGLAARAPPELDLDAPTIERTESVPARRAPALVVPAPPPKTALALVKTTLPLVATPIPRAAAAPVVVADPPPSAGPSARSSPASPVPSTGRPTRTSLVVVALACAILVFGVGAFAVTRFARTPAPAESASARTPAPGASTVERAIGSSSPAAISPPIDPAPSTSAVVEDPSSLPSEPASSATAALSGPPSATSAAPRPLPTVDARCSPPYFYDDKHMKRFKPGCVR